MRSPFMLALIKTRGNEIEQQVNLSLTNLGSFVDRRGSTQTQIFQTRSTNLLFSIGVPRSHFDIAAIHTSVTSYFSVPPRKHHGG